MCPSQPRALVAVWPKAGRHSRTWESVPGNTALPHPWGTLAVCYQFFSVHPSDAVRAGMRQWGQGLLSLRAPVWFRDPGELTGMPFRAGFIKGANHWKIWVSRTGKVSGCPHLLPALSYITDLMASQYLVEIELRVFLFRQSLQATK